MNGCARSAWLVLGGQSLPLESVAGGWFCESLDLGYPTVRDVVNNRPDRDGIDDRTLLFGERTVTANLKAVAGAGAQIDAVAASFAPFMTLTARPVLHYILDRPGYPERTMVVRAAGYAWAVTGPSERAIQLQWVAADPAARAAVAQLGVAWSGATGGAGRQYPLTFPRVYPAGGGGPVTATLSSPGDVAVWPLLRIYGPITGPTVTFTASGQPAGVMAMAAGYVISGGGQFVEIDCNQKTAFLNGDRSQNVLTSLDWVQIQNGGGWPRLMPAVATTMALVGASTGMSTQVQASWFDGYLS